MRCKSGLHFATLRNCLLQKVPPVFEKHHFFKTNPCCHLETISKSPLEFSKLHVAQLWSSFSTPCLRLADPPYLHDRSSFIILPLHGSKQDDHPRLLEQDHFGSSLTALDHESSPFMRKTHILPNISRFWTRFFSLQIRSEFFWGVSFGTMSASLLPKSLLEPHTFALECFLLPLNSHFTFQSTFSC